MPKASVTPNGPRIVELRSVHDMTQQELAEKAGYSKKTIERLENGKRTKYRTILDVAEVFEIATNTLLKDESATISQAKALVEIVINDDLYDSPKEAQAKIMDCILQLVDEAKAVMVRRGSVVLTIEIDKQNISRLLKFIQSEQFADMGVQQTQVVNQIAPAILPIHDNVVSSFEIFDIADSTETTEILPASLVLVGIAFAASMVFRNCANDFLRRAYTSIWNSLRTRLGREPERSNLKNEIEQFMSSDTESVVHDTGEIFSQSSSLRRAVLVRRALKGANVIWIDDNPDWVSFESAFLSEFGVNVTLTTNVQDAMNLMSSSPPDLIISDIRRGDRPAAGLEGLEIIKSSYPDISVLFYIGHVEESLGVPNGAWGICDSPEELFHLVMDLLERKRLT